MPTKPRSYSQLIVTPLGLKVTAALAPACVTPTTLTALAQNQHGVGAIGQERHVGQFVREPRRNGAETETRRQRKSPRRRGGRPHADRHQKSRHDPIGQPAPKAVETSPAS